MVCPRDWSRQSLRSQVNQNPLGSRGRSSNPPNCGSAVAAVGLDRVSHSISSRSIDSRKVALSDLFGLGTGSDWFGLVRSRSEPVLGGLVRWFGSFRTEPLVPTVRVTLREGVVRLVPNHLGCDRAWVTPRCSDRQDSRHLGRLAWCHRTHSPVEDRGRSPQRAEDRRR